MTCEEFLETVGAYALGSLSQAEREACGAHLAEDRVHAGCERAFEEAQTVSVNLAWALPDQPPRPEVWAAIESRVALKKDR